MQTGKTLSYDSDRKIFIKQDYQKVVGNNDTWAETFYSNKFVNIQYPNPGYFNFDTPIYYTIGGTSKYYEQDSNSVFTNTTKPAITFVFTAHTENIRTGSTIIKHQIYKIDYDTYLNSQDKDKYAEAIGFVPQTTTLNTNSQQQNHNIVSSAMTTPIITLTASTTAVTTTNTYDLIFDEYYKVPGKRSKILFEDKSQYFLTTQFLFHREQGDGYCDFYNLGVDKSLTPIDYQKDYLESTLARQHVITAGTFTGISVKGNFFTYFLIPNKPKINEPYVNGLLSTFSPTFYFSDVDDGDEYVLQVMYGCLNPIDYLLKTAESSLFSGTTEEKIIQILDQSILIPKPNNICCPNCGLYLISDVDSYLKYSEATGYILTGCTDSTLTPIASMDTYLKFAEAVGDPIPISGQNIQANAYVIDLSDEILDVGIVEYNSFDGSTMIGKLMQNGLLTRDILHTGIIIDCYSSDYTIIASVETYLKYAESYNPIVFDSLPCVCNDEKIFFNDTAISYFIEKSKSNLSTNEMINTPDGDWSITQETTDIMRKYSIPLKANSFFWYRIGNIKKIINLFGTEQSVVTYSDTMSATTPSTIISTLVRVEANSPYVESIATPEIPYYVDGTNLIDLEILLTGGTLTDWSVNITYPNGQTFLSNANIFGNCYFVGLYPGIYTAVTYYNGVDMNLYSTSGYTTQSGCITGDTSWNLIVESQAAYENYSKYAEAVG